MRLGTAAEKLQEVGVQTLGIVASKAERARFYLRFRPIRCAVGADPDLITHRAYGVPQSAMTPELWQAVEASAASLAGELRLQAPVGQAYDAIGRLDGYKLSDDDKTDEHRQEGQATAQFLIGRDGIIRWAYIEAQEGLAGVNKFPTDEELLAAARAL